MNRWLLFFVCTILGLVMLLCGLLVPIHLRAVDPGVLQRAGRNTPSLVDQGLTLVGQNKLGPAQMLLQTAQQQSLPNREKLATAISNLAGQQPGLSYLGAPEPRLEILLKSRKPSKATFEPFTELMVGMENREKALQFLQGSTRPSVQELLHTRTLTNTVIFPPSTSSAGQAYDTAVAICGLLLDHGQLNKGLSEAIVAQASAANRGESPERLEQSLMDIMSLGQRLNWGQLVSFVGSINAPESLRILANQIRNANEQLPVVFSSMQLSGNPEAVSRYLSNFQKSGPQDLAASLKYNSGGVKELVKRDQRISDSKFLKSIVGYEPFASFHHFAADYCWLMPGFSIAIKWLLYLGAGFLLALAVHYLLPAFSGLEKPLHVRGIHYAREFLFAMGLLLVIILATEPFLSPENQKMHFPFKLRVPTMGSTASVAKTNADKPLMNQLQTNMLTLLLFFVLQGLIYIACLVKLAEIRRQQVPSRTKLKLLENEEHLFDAGLYLGFAGTIVSLILVSMGISKFSIMAAYSSTSFGIAFVSIFKIFHLRPMRRKLLLEAEASQPEPVNQTATTTSSVVVPS